MGWTTVRVSHATLAALESVRASMERGEDNATKRPALVHDTRDRIGLDQVIQLLVDFRQRHAARRRKAKRTARQKRRAHGQIGTEAKPGMVSPGDRSPAAPIHPSGTE